ncbi:MAG TPA: bifunctional (p)ppGpp synthetase/guanosine-3',5'-bis(diphosphate) 3'-pyrophosphohydrolase [Alphaproteobacteria bacterium]|nr:bifunctional (p)ppGpp synthetase/guanosine-3',5'-bis(diphosphate) 3'-pyrophosphohydrolase [Alphaproteobacteria bacterium]
MIRQYELVERVKAIDPTADEDALNRAYVFSMKAHGTQKRASGDPYFSHPLEVAGILTQLKLDSASIITALLHDTIEDTLTTLEEIERLFGPEIARLVDGVTKLSRLELQSEQTRQAENFRKLLLAMSDDIRVLLVKLADRLHNMRTLEHVASPEKRRAIARETMEIFAPLAERIGMQEIKSELEDLAFGELNPDGRESILARLEFLRQEGGAVVARILRALEETLAGGGLAATVGGREKKPYSVWRKMQHKQVGFEQLSDIMAFRVVVPDVESCYRALGVLHGAYPMVPGRFKDYISTPKPNGYRSLHTSLIGPERQRIEVQIRTEEMHRAAELGVAAHWAYKQEHGVKEGRQYRWLRELLEILEHAAGPEEFLEHTKLEMFQDQVFCFSPKGDVIALPRRATPIDFAYAVHSEVGDTCVGAKINGRLAPVWTELQNGDQVEIIRSKVAAPSPTWEKFVVTGKARTRLRRFVRSQERSEYISLGRSIAEKVFREAEHDFSEKLLEDSLGKFKLRSRDELYLKLGEGRLPGRQLIDTIFPYARLREVVGNVLPLVRRRTKKEHDSGAVPIKGLIPGMAVHFAECCHPLPGDRIVGILTTGKGVTIHTIDCETLESFQDAPENWLDVSWQQTSEAPGAFVGRLHVTLANEPGSLGKVSTVIGRHLGNISNLKITSRSPDFFEMVLDVEVEDVKHLTNIVAALRAVPAISSVERARG